LGLNIAGKVCWLFQDEKNNRYRFARPFGATISGVCV